MEIEEENPTVNQGRNRNRIKIEVTYGDFPLDAQTTGSTIYCDTMLIEAMSVSTDGTTPIIYILGKDGGDVEANHLLMFKMWAFFMTTFLLHLENLDEFYKKIVKSLRDTAMKQDSLFQTKKVWNPSERTNYSDN